MTVIDLRSDTVTKPTPEMKEAMMAAPVGDDVFGEDPTINELESFAAELTGKEAALFCPSGTMTNQIAIRIHTRPGSEVICSDRAHIYWYEGGGMAANSMSQARLLSGAKGHFTAADVRSAVNPDDIHAARTSLVAVENTCNKGGGTVWNHEEILRIGHVCKDLDIPFHLDGARVFNAFAASGQNPKEGLEPYDTVSICLSKGLGAPVGSLLLGSEKAIREARRVRKSFGGGMRQGGSIAGAGLYALKNHITRLAEDHEKARVLEQAMKEAFGEERVIPVETNIVIAELPSIEKAADVLAFWQSKGLMAVSMGGSRVRLVTHLDFSPDQLDQAVQIIKQSS